MVFLTLREEPEIMDQDFGCPHSRPIFPVVFPGPDLPLQVDDVSLGEKFVSCFGQLVPGLASVPLSLFVFFPILPFPRLGGGERKIANGNPRIGMPEFGILPEAT
jgi:hypothetical protein